MIADPGVAAFRDWLVAQVAGPGADGWRNAAERYRWYGYELDLTLETRRRQKNKLAAAGDDLARWREACDHVAEWGGQDRWSDEDLAGLRAGCRTLAREPSQPLDFFFRRAATTSKVYAALHPTRWVVYDSRLALRLACFVRQWWEEEQDGTETSAQFLRFPSPPGRAGIAPPTGFPRLGTEKQARLAFIYASWLFRDIAVQLERLSYVTPDDVSQWTAQVVEMVLFAKSE